MPHEDVTSRVVDFHHEYVSRLPSPLTSRLLPGRSERIVLTGGHDTERSSARPSRIANECRFLKFDEYVILVEWSTDFFIVADAEGRSSEYRSSLRSLSRLLYRQFSSVYRLD